MANIGADLLLTTFRGPDLNQNTDINADDYHVVDSAADITVMRGVVVDVHAFHFCVYYFACTKSL